MEPLVAVALIAVVALLLASPFMAVFAFVRLQALAGERGTVRTELGPRWARVARWTASPATATAATTATPPPVPAPAPAMSSPPPLPPLIPTPLRGAAAHERPALTPSEASVPR